MKTDGLFITGLAAVFFILEASFDEMRKQYGTIEGYFAEGLGIDAAQQKALRDLYLGTQ